MISSSQEDVNYTARLLLDEMLSPSDIIGVAEFLSAKANNNEYREKAFILLELTKMVGWF